MKTNDLLIIGVLGIGAYFLFKYFSGSANGSSFGGGGGNGGGGGGPGGDKGFYRRDYTGKTGYVPVVQQAPNVITRGTITQIGQPAYSGRSTPYIRTDVPKPSQIQFQKDPIGSLRSMIGFQVTAPKASSYPVGTPQNPATPLQRQTGILIPMLRR